MTAFTSAMLPLDGPLRDTVNEHTTPGDSARGSGWAAPDPAHIIDRAAFCKVPGVSVVLITRPEPGASETAARIEAMGLMAVIAPTLEIRRYQAVLRGLSRITATLLTSSNAIAGCPPKCRELPVFTVGDATAARAREAGFTDVRSAGGDAMALADLVATTLLPDAGSLLLPTGHRLGADLAGDLRSRGFRVIRRTVYRTHSPAALPGVARSHLLRHDVAAALFFSAETARHFVDLIQKAGLDQTVNSVAAISISERAGVALRALPWLRISVASRPNQDAMLALLQ
jgi:uroporphyrinogen-III synthase